MEHFKTAVCDRSMKVGGHQCIRTLEGCILPLNIINGLPYLPMAPNTKEEWDTLPHVILTSGDRWTPKILDHDLSSSPDWFNQIKLPQEMTTLMDGPFDQRGEYKHVEPETTVPEEPVVPVENNLAESDTKTDFIECFRAASDLNQRCVVLEEDVIETSKSPAQITHKIPDYDKFRPYFLHVPKEKIKRTFDVTTQHASNVMSGHIITQTAASPFPAHNVRRRNEPVSSDTTHAEVAAVDSGGVKMAQIFVGIYSKVIDAFGMKTGKEFVNTLLDCIRKRGAPDMLQTDSANVERSARVLDVLRNLIILDHSS